jgi:hypothetical protein
MDKNTTNHFIYDVSKLIVSLSLFVFLALPASAQLYLNDGAILSLANSSSLVSVMSNIQTNNNAASGVKLYNNGNILLTGDFINNNVALNQTGGGAPQNGTVHFQGTTSAEQISGTTDLTGNAAFYNVEINNTNAASKLVYQNNVNTQVKSILTFTSGRLRTDANPVGDGSTTKEIYISNPSPAAIVGDANTWALYQLALPVYDKFIEGRLRWNTVTGNSYIFPIGTMKNPAPAGGNFGQQYVMVNNSASGDASVSFTELIPVGCTNIAAQSQFDCMGHVAAAGTLISTLLNHGHWNLIPPSGSSMTLNLGENGGVDCNPGTLDHTFLTSINNGLTWIVNGTNGVNSYCNPGPNPGVAYNGLLKRVTVTDGNSWLAEGSSVDPILPIQLLSFTAEKYGDVQESQLNWSTATEQNSKDFEIQWSTNGANWETIGIVDAAGNSQTQKDYSFIHTSPVTGINYYQLKEVDMNNNATYSNVREVLFTGNGSITITPNPAINSAIIHCTYDNPHISYEVINVLGQRIASGLLTSSSLPMDLRMYPSGMYYFRFDVNNNLQVIPVVKQQ